MRHFRWMAGMIIALSPAIGLAQEADLAARFADVEPVELFDSETFDGWEGDLEWFRIEDGAIVAGRTDKRIPHNQFLCTEASYDDFELRFLVKTGAGNPNGGIQFRSKRVPDSTEVSGYQADVGWDFWGHLYDESRRNRMLVTPDADLIAEALKPDDWNEYIIRAVGGRIQLVLNGVVTVDYTEPDKSVARKGKICLQIHSGPPGEIRHKDLTIRRPKGNT